MAKKPKAGASSRVAKTPAIAAGIEVADLRPVWRTRWLDRDGPWGWDKISQPELEAVASFLRAMEALTWKQVWAQQAGGERRRGAKHKYIPMADCVDEAQRRLRNLRLAEYDGNWFRFRLQGQWRLWGIEQEGVFNLVWWDAHHQVCP